MQLRISPDPFPGIINTFIVLLETSLNSTGILSENRLLNKSSDFYMSFDSANHIPQSNMCCVNYP